MPEEVNIDELLELKTDEERRHRLQVHVRPSVRLMSVRPSVVLPPSHVRPSLFQDIFHSCSSEAEVRPRLGS